jgi:DNA-binding CsgD family transcriptional regulator
MNLLTLLHEGAYGWLALFLCLFYGSWYISFKLSYKIVGEKMPPAIHLSIFLMVAFVAGARPFFPHLTFVMLMGALMVILLCMFGRLNIYKSIYAAVLSIFTSYLGDIFLLHLALGLYPKLFPFVFGSRWGFLIACGVEALFPIIALSITDPSFSLRLPLRSKSAPFDLFDMGVCWILICMYYAIDYAMITAFEALQTNPQKIGSSLGFLFMTSFGTISGIIILIRCMKFMHDIEVRRLTAEKVRIKEEKEQVEAENMNLQEKMYTILDLNANLDPNVKKTIVDSFIAVFEEGIKKSSKPKPPFIINQSKMAEYGIEERDSKILAHLVLHKSNQEIASELDYTEGHIANSLTEMYKKLKLKGRRQLIRFTLENKLVEIP